MNVSDVVVGEDQFVEGEIEETVRGERGNFHEGLASAVNVVGAIVADA